MGFVFETITNTDIQPDVALGVKISNANSIFASVYTIADQTKENLKSLILTRIGERYMLPEFGTNLLNMLFEPISYEFNDGVSTSITNAINRWLPYVVVENLKVVTALDDPSLQHMVEISLTYSVQNFNTNSIKIFASETGNITVV